MRPTTSIPRPITPIAPRVTTKNTDNFPPGNSPSLKHAMASSLRQMLPRRSILAAPSARAWASQRGLASQRRTYSIAAPDAADPKLQAIDLSKLQVQKTTTPKELMSNN